jgi:intracellular sulfur oxidation DsrE/DsrF family protein
MGARSTAYLFMRFGLGQAPEDLQLRVVGNFLTLLEGAEERPAGLLFYTDGVKLVCEGSPVLDHLRKFESQGVDVISCRTCIEYFGLTEEVRVGRVGGMPAIMEAIARANKVVSV